MVASEVLHMRMPRRSRSSPLERNSLCGERACCAGLAGAALGGPRQDSSSAAGRPRAAA